MFKPVLATAILALSITSAYAKETKTIPPVLKAAEGYAGLVVIKDFKAAGGLQGWVVNSKSENKNIVVYTTQDGTVLLGGIALDAKGKNLTAEYTEQHVPPPDYSAATAEFTKDGASSGVTVGQPTAKAEVTIVFDANCGFCKVMHNLLTPAVDAGQLMVRYVPVAILGADSAPKGAALLATASPKALLDTFAAGGKGELSNDSALLAKVKANTELMRKHGFNGTPTVFYTGAKNGTKVQMVSNGLPAITEFFNSLGIDGQLDKLKADPKLQQFVR